MRDGPRFAVRQLDVYTPRLFLFFFSLMPRPGRNEMPMVEILLRRQARNYFPLHPPHAFCLVLDFVVVLQP